MAKAVIRSCQRTLALVVLVVVTCLALSSGGALAQKGKAAEDTLEAFDRNNFDNSANVDNKWFPLQPGTQLVYKGFTQEDEKRVPARVVQTVTDLTKVVNGVRSGRCVGRRLQGRQGGRIGDRFLRARQGRQRLAAG